MKSDCLQNLVPSDFSLSIIMLAYNEEESIFEAIKDVADFLKSISGSHEIIVVNDGSTDETLERANEALSLYPDIRIISHEQNRGMGAGTRTGIQHAKCNYFTIIGADRQISPFELKKMIPKLKDADIVLSTYVERPSFLRKFLSKAMRVFIKMMLNFTIPYEGLYILPRKVILEKIGLANIHSNSFFFSFEMLYFAKSLGLKMSSVPIMCLERTKGKSKVVNFKKILNVIKEIMDLRLRNRKEFKEDEKR